MLAFIVLKPEHSPWGSPVPRVLMDTWIEQVTEGCHSDVLCELGVNEELLTIFAMSLSVPGVRDERRRVIMYPYCRRSAQVKARIASLRIEYALNALVHSRSDQEKVLRERPPSFRASVLAQKVPILDHPIAGDMAYLRP